MVLRYILIFKIFNHLPEARWHSAVGSAADQLRDRKEDHGTAEKQAFEVAVTWNCNNQGAFYSVLF